MSSLKSRVLVSVVGVPLLLWVVLGAPTFVIVAALCLLAGIGAVELQQCVSGERKSVLIALGAVAAVLTVACYHLCPQYVYILVIVELVTFFGYAIIKGGEVKFAQVMAGLFGSFAISYSFSAFIRMEDAGYHRIWLLLPFVLSFACDTCAYFVGCSIGKHKLAPKVSPKKSVEGAVGGLIGNVLFGMLFLWVATRFYGGTTDGYSGYAMMAVMGLFCGVVSQIGDLSFSLIKREFGVKDYGKLFLAHGGVLDRFDSVLFVAPVVELILKWM
jgi:phosphatidate cytidylyltransferase